MIEKSISLFPKKSRETIKILVRDMPNVNEQTIWSYLQFKKNYKVNEQIHELETLISETQNHIEKLSTSLIPENNAKWLEIKHYFD